MYGAFRQNLMAYGGAHIVALLVALAFSFRPDPRPAVVVGFCLLVGLAQLVGGSLNSFSRYEIYVLVLGLAGLMVLHGPALDGWLARLRPGRAVLACLAALVLFGGYALRTVDAVPAAGNVADQQRSMHQFVTQEWRLPFATNHPGWVNWRNPHYMLDLSGLGSFEARQGALSADPDWAGKLVGRHGVALAMLYDNAIPRTVPGDWQPLARLTLRNRVVTAVGPSITFYATKPDAVAAVRDALLRFRPNLPNGVVLGFVPAILAAAAPVAAE